MTVDVNLSALQLPHLEIPIYPPTTMAQRWVGTQPKECACGGYHPEVEDWPKDPIQKGWTQIQTLSTPQGSLEEAVRSYSWDATSSLAEHRLYPKTCCPLPDHLARRNILKED